MKFVITIILILPTLTVSIQSGDRLISKTDFELDLLSPKLLDYIISQKEPELLQNVDNPKLLELPELPIMRQQTLIQESKFQQNKANEYLNKVLMNYEFPEDDENINNTNIQEQDFIQNSNYGTSAEDILPPEVPMFTPESQEVFIK